MTILPILLDERPGYLARPGAPESLLLAPLGAGCVLDRLRDWLAALTPEAPTIATRFPPSAAYRAALEQRLPRCSVGPLAALAALMAQREPSDWILLVDPCWLPAGPDDLRTLCQEAGAPPVARHLLRVDRSPRGTRECVQLDPAGRVQRIQRYYDGVTWAQGRAVTASLVPLGTLPRSGPVEFADLATLRELLAASGVLSRDRMLTVETFDLRTAGGLLQLNEHALRAGPPRSRSGVQVGPHCRVHASARLCGPVVLQEGVRIGPGVTLVGPAVLGARSRIERDALVAHCVLAAGSRVPPGAQLAQQFVCGTAAAGSTAAADGAVQGGACAVIDAGWGPGSGEARSTRRLYVGLKRTIDTLISLVGLAAVAPLMLLVAVAIKLTSRGPVLFAHLREGLGGRPFRCWKFRTMAAGAHGQQRDLYRQNQLDGPQFMLRNDPRITPLGRWLRLTNIDELPQLFNVLLGQMSLIGPRPSPFRENQICVPWRTARLSVRPGITGLWQICRQQRSAGDFHQWIYYDMLYVRHVSPGLDLRILLATLLTAGGRWSVPLTWIISARRLRADQEFRASIGQHRLSHIYADAPCPPHPAPELPAA